MFALVAFKDTLSTNIFPLNQLIGPKKKVAGATVKVYFDGLLQKGTIITVTDNIHWLVRESENLDVARYFGLSTCSTKKSGPINTTSFQGHSTPKCKRSSSVLKDFHPLSPINVKPRRHSACGIIRPSTVKSKANITRNSTVGLPPVFNKLPVIKSNERRKTVCGIKSIIVSNSKVESKAQKSFIASSMQETNTDTKTNRNKNQMLITDYFQPNLPLRSVDVSTSALMNLSSFLSSYNYLLQPITLPLLHEESFNCPSPNSKTDGKACNTNKTFTKIVEKSSTFQSGSGCDHMTPMQVFSRVLWDIEHSSLQDPWMITVNALKDIRSKSKTPELFARNLMYRMFTIGELKTSYQKGCLPPNKMPIINQLTHDMFPGVPFRWSDCMKMMNDSISYAIQLSGCLT